MAASRTSGFPFQYKEWKSSSYSINAISVLVLKHVCDVNHWFWPCSNNMVTPAIILPWSFSQYLKFWSYFYCKVTHKKGFQASKLDVCAKDELSLMLWWASTIAAVTQLLIPEQFQWRLHLWAAAGSFSKVLDWLVQKSAQHQQPASLACASAVELRWHWARTAQVWWNMKGNRGMTFLPACLLQQKNSSASEHAGVVRLGSRTRERSQPASLTVFLKIKWFG